MENNSLRASAVVAAYNEQPRIGKVLEALTHAERISEIIVVDDGSSDGTAEFVRKTFPSVRCLANEQNCGKAFSMDRGVKESTSDIVFFCDADLVGLTPEMIDAMVLPVINNEYDMFIGVRNNIMQKSFMPFGRNSGERAMRKTVWQKLPDFYKHRFRIEVGLNLMVRFTTQKGTGFIVMPYFQTLKETKYGFWKGQWQRWRMNFDVSVGWLRAVWEFFILAHIFKNR